MLHNDIIQHTVMITIFVMVMMMIIEYVNVQTRGRWYAPLKKNKWIQVLFAAVLGAIPGCLGTYTIVSLYTHKIIGFGALATTMIATSGDEAFLMFSLVPDTALIITASIFLIAIATGFSINLFAKKRPSLIANKDMHLELHEEESRCFCFERKNILKNIAKPSFHRMLLISGLLLFIWGLSTGNFAHQHQAPSSPAEATHESCEHEHEHPAHTAQLHEQESEHKSEHHEEVISHAHSHAHNGGVWNWFSITFLLCSLIALFIIITVPDHFLTDHLWGHIIKKHFLKILLWTLATLSLIAFLMQYIELSEWVKTNQLYILLFAVLIGIIPQSGPHLIFLSMFVNGTIPLSILMANSIVQDGHGALPLFAESKRSFFWVKALNVAIGLCVGLLGYFIGW